MMHRRKKSKCRTLVKYQSDKVQRFGDISREFIVELKCKNVYDEGLRWGGKLPSSQLIQLQSIIGCAD